MIDDVFDTFDTLPTLDDLREQLEEDEEIIIAAGVLENLLEKLRTFKEELNDYHIRDAEMEGWVSMPRDRHLRFLGLEAENLELIDRVTAMEEDFSMGGTKDFIVQPPEDAPDDSWMELPEEDAPKLDPFDFGGTQTTSTPEFGDVKIVSDPAIVGQACVGGPHPLKWHDIVNLTQADVEEVAKAVLRRIKES